MTIEPDELPALTSAHGARRTLVRSAAVVAASLIFAGCGSTTSATSTPPLVTSHDVTGTIDMIDDLKALESQFDARVGIAALDTGTGTRVEYRAGERFGYASTLKAFAAAQLLLEVPTSDRDDTVTWDQAQVDAAGYSPVTSEHVEDGLTVAQLAEAAVRDSDNTAMNLILERLGGPAGLDDGLTRLGDATTQVVNLEPDLNTIEPGGTDDTTTPTAFTANLESFLDPTMLTPGDQRLWVDWMSNNATGDSLIRAGAPQGWAVADKSGGAGAIRNDIAIVSPPGRKPILITVLTTRNSPDAEYDDELVARAAELALGSMR